MVPGAVTGAGASPNGAPPVVADPGAVTDEPVLRIDRAGPGGGVPSDNAFGVALVSLWQRVIEAGGSVGFAPPVVRPEVAARAAGLVDEIRTGRVIAVAANRSHRLIGAGLLRPGRGTAEHTGHLELLLVNPEQTRAGVGAQLPDRGAPARPGPRTVGGGPRRGGRSWSERVLHPLRVRAMGAAAELDPDRAR